MSKTTLPKTLLTVVFSALSMTAAVNPVTAEQTNGQTDTPPETTEKAIVEPAKTPPERAETRRDKRLQQQIEQIDPHTKASWLGIKPDQFLALYRADATGKTHANLILLHDNQQHPDWPGLVHQIRIQLVKHGWNTLSIAVPDLASSEVLPAIKPEITPPAENAAASENPPAVAVNPDQPQSATSVEYPMSEVAEQLAQRIQEAIGFVRTQSAAPIFIAGIGSSATLLEQQSQIMASQTLSGVVLIDAASIPKLEGTAISPSDLELLTLPVLDLVPQFNQRSDPEARRNDAAQRHRDNYQQRLIPGAGQGFDQFEKIIINAIRGWAKNLLRGDRAEF